MGLHYSRRTERPVYTHGPTSNHLGECQRGEWTSHLDPTSRVDLTLTVFDCLEISDDAA